MTEKNVIKHDLWGIVDEIRERPIFKMAAIATTGINLFQNV